MLKYFLLFITLVLALQNEVRNVGYKLLTRHNGTIILLSCRIQCLIRSGDGDEQRPKGCCLLPSLDFYVTIDPK